MRRTLGVISGRAKTRVLLDVRGRDHHHGVHVLAAGLEQQRDVEHDHVGALGRLGLLEEADAVAPTSGWTIASSRVIASSNRPAPAAQGFAVDRAVRSTPGKAASSGPTAAPPAA
jgi:hypothetical protein